MRELGPGTLKRLSSQTGFPRVTIQLTMEPRGREVRKNRIALTNAVSRALKRLTELGVSEADATGFMQPVLDLANDEDQMEHQNEGVSIFVDESGYEEVQLPFGLEERVEVGNRFSVAQLVEPAVNNEEFAVLALSLGGVGLYRCSRFTGEYVPLADLPEDLCYVLRYDQFEKSSGHVHTTSARGDSMHHGHGMGHDEHDAFVQRFVDAVRPVVTDWVERNRLPLVLIGADEVIGHYRKADTYAGTVAEDRHVDPHALSLDELIDLGWACVRPRIDQRRAAALERFHAADHRAVDVYGVLPALYEGRVATLIVDPHEQIHGVFEESTGSVHVDRRASGIADDLVDVALAKAFETEVEVVVVDGEMPTPAAILR